MKCSVVQMFIFGLCFKIWKTPTGISRFLSLKYIYFVGGKKRKRVYIGGIIAAGNVYFPACLETLQS